MKRLVADTGPILHLHEAGADSHLGGLGELVVVDVVTGSRVSPRRAGEAFFSWPLKTSAVSAGGLGKGMDSTAANLVKISLRFLTADDMDQHGSEGFMRRQSSPGLLRSQCASRAASTMLLLISFSVNSIG